MDSSWIKRCCLIRPETRTAMVVPQITMLFLKTMGSRLLINVWICTFSCTHYNKYFAGRLYNYVLLKRVKGCDLKASTPNQSNIQPHSFENWEMQKQLFWFSQEDLRETSVYYKSLSFFKTKYFLISFEAKQPTHHECTLQCCY